MVSNQQFRLKWNNHRNTVLQEFGTLLHNNSFVDCTIGAEGKYVKAHKIILSACSPYFQNVFSEHFDKHPVVLLKDVLFKELKCMIDYMYCGEVNISECELPSFLRTAQSLKIKGLAEDISEYDSASDSEQAVSSYSENSRTVEANVEIHDDDGPPAKKSSTPCILSTKIVNDSMAGRKRKSPNSTVPSAGKSNSQARVGTIKVSNSTKSDEFSNSGTETEISSQCSASKEDISPEDNDSSRKAPSQNDLREPSKKAEVKEEPVENDIDNDDNSSYECGNNICEDTDPLNEDSESNCANSGNKFSEVSIASVSSYNENDANGRGSPNSEKIVKRGCEKMEAEVLGKGRRKKFKNTKYEADYGASLSEDEDEEKERKQSSGSARNEDLINLMKKLKRRSRSRVRSAGKLTRLFSGFTKETSAGRKRPVARHRRSSSQSAFVVHNPQYRCDGCGRNYRWREGLASHKRLYCGKEPRFKCPYCDKKTFQKINLDTHISTYHANATI